MEDLEHSSQSEPAGAGMTFPGFLPSRELGDDPLTQSITRERLRLALDASGMGAWEWRISEQRVIWSETLERIHGIEPGSFGGTFDDYQRDIHPDDRTLVLESVARTLNGEPHRLRYRIIRPDGAVRWLEARATLLRDSAGMPFRLVGVCSDVTERERAERALLFLADAGGALHTTLDIDTMFQNVSRLAVPLLGDYCVFDVLDNGRVRRAAAEHADEAAREAVAQLKAADPESLGAGLVADVMRTGTSRLVRNWDSTPSVGDAVNSAHGELVAQLEPQSLLSVPLRARDGSVQGALTFVMSGSGRRHDEYDLQLAEALAGRAGKALENARLHAATVDAREQLEQQALELELQTQQLQEQAAEMEAQQAELEQHTEELQTANSELLIAREAAEAAHAQIAAILGAIADPFVVYDREWRFQYVNDAAARILDEHGRVGNRSPIGRSVWELYPDLAGTRSEQEMQRAQRERVPVVFEEHYASLGFWAEMRCYPMPDGGVAIMWKDITAKKHAAERLHYLSRASEILAGSLDYRTTVQQVAQLLVPRLADWCGVQLVNERGVLEQLAVAHVDPKKVAWAWELNRRYPVDMNAATGAPNVLRTGVPELYANISDEMLVAGAIDDEHLAMLRELGMTSVLVVPLVAREQVIGVMSLVAAESGRRYTAAEQALALELAQRAALAIDNARLFTETRDARAAAEAANRAKAEFLATMSHELRTPLNAIGGYTDLLLMGVRGQLSEGQREDVERIKRSGQHLLGLINDVLNFAKLEAGRVELSVRDHAIAPLLDGLEDLVRPQVQARGLRYTLRGTDRAVSVRADAEKVRQILLNLLANAVKFTEPGGEIEVTCDATTSEARIHVRDTGRGIPREQLQRVFDPFVQVERHLTPASQQGVGLGLAISRDLARAMRGELSAVSEVGVGSTFTLVLPRA
jgi:PAS domain S-box-containing protein